MVYPGSPALNGVDHDEVLNSKTVDLIFRFHRGGVVVGTFLVEVVNFRRSVFVYFLKTKDLVCKGCRRINFAWVYI